MSRAWYCFALVLASSAPALGQPDEKPAGNPVGNWLGIIQGGPSEVRLGFQISKDKEGKFTGKGHSIEERLDFPLKSIVFKGDKLSFEIGGGDGYSGTLEKTGNSITGVLKLFGQEIPLRLTRVEKLPTLHRPQEPKGPLPYHAENLTFSNEAAKIKLAGTLTMPKGDGPFPAVVLLSGSGPHDRDSAMAGHKPFLVIADHLARQGIACLRFDKRGIGRSGGKYYGTTGADFAADGHAALKHLQTIQKIDPKKLGLVGHSEGGISAMVAAADHPDEVAFLVLLAAGGVAGDVLLYEQMLDNLKRFDDKTNPKEVKELTESMVAILQSPKNTVEVQKALKALMDQNARKVVGDSLRKQFEEGIPVFVNHYADPGRRWVITHDPAVSMRKIKCPVLALNGGGDTVVKAKQNLQAIEAGLKAGGNRQVATVEFPGLNHLFQKCKTGLPAEYSQIEETFAPEALQRMSAWIAGRKGAD